MRFNCNYWQLAGSIPPLKELSVCVDIQRSITTPQWTVFMYSHPDRSHVDISLEGSDKHLFLWLFGTRWSTKFSIRLNVWYSVCITWSEFALSPRLYINGNPVEIHSIREPLTLSSRNIASDGYLTLGASHFILNNEIHAVTGTDFQGYLTLFRMWSEELPASQLKHCVDGDVVRWDAEDWITRGCAPVDDAHLQCGEFIFHSVGMVTNIPCEQNYMQGRTGHRGYRGNPRWADRVWAGPIRAHLRGVTIWGAAGAIAPGPVALGGP